MNQLHSSLVGGTHALTFSLHLLPFPTTLLLRRSSLFLIVATRRMTLLALARRSFGGRTACGTSDLLALDLAPARTGDGSVFVAQLACDGVEVGLKVSVLGSRW